ncbi:MAG: DNA double-strand break repair protein Rad50, partial [Vigna little leaf phytoplasma]|nr:DNA double-strand break repair protein Rad50 [Vigna little leaf phytoplasma]
KALLAQQALTQDQKAQIQTALAENEKNINNIKAQLKETTTNIAILKGELIQLEKEKEVKEQEIKQKQEAEKLASPDDKIRLQAEISQLKQEKSEIIGRIEDINVKIGNLEADRTCYQGMLASAEAFKKDLEKRYQTLSGDEKSLFNQIKSAEERYAEIQKNIEEIDVKLKEIKDQKAVYEHLKLKFQTMYTQTVAYEKEHEASFGNIAKAGFKLADVVKNCFLVGKAMNIAEKALVPAIKSLGEGEGLGGAMKMMFTNLGNLPGTNDSQEKSLPEMLTKEGLAMLLKDIDRNVTKLDADYKDYEQKKEGYKQRQNADNLREEFDKSQQQVNRIKKRRDGIINEYREIVRELTHKRNEASKNSKLSNDRDDLEQVLETKKDEISVLEEQLKQKNPSYARAQERLKKKRLGKLPEMVVINN